MVDIIYIVVERYINRDSGYDDSEIITAFLKEENAKKYCETHKSTRLYGCFSYEDVKIEDCKE